MSKFWPSPIFLSSYCHTFPAHFFDGSTQGRWYSLQNIPIFSGIWVYSHMVISYNVTTLKRPASTKKVDFSKKTSETKKHGNTQSKTDWSKKLDRKNHKKNKIKIKPWFSSVFFVFMLFLYIKPSVLSVLLDSYDYPRSHPVMDDHVFVLKAMVTPGDPPWLKNPPAISHDIPMICLTWLNHSFHYFHLFSEFYSYRERERQI